MEIKKKVQDAINKQINRELYSAYLYLSMASYFESENLKGFAHWMKKQASEELKHGMKMFEYVIERGGKATLTGIEAPQITWKSPAHAFGEAYEHEKKVTEFINGVADVAASEKDRATEVFLQWFINEQVEEENSANEILQKLKVIGDKGSALLMLDHQLGKRE